jgi:hypothetical protein
MRKIMQRKVKKTTPMQGEVRDGMQGGIRGGIRGGGRMNDRHRRLIFAWRNIWGEARSRILLMYVLLMLLVAAASIPIFLFLFTASVDAEVKEDLVKNMESFQVAYEQWHNQPAEERDTLKHFATEFLAQEVIQDDSYLLFYIKGKFYKSTPRALPTVISPGLTIERHWLKQIKEPTEGKIEVPDPEVGSVIYLAQPIFVDGKMRGIFVAAHLTASERQEIFRSALLFGQVTIGVIAVGCELKKLWVR